MAYTDVSEMAADMDLRQRLYACIATLGWSNGEMWIDRWAWQIVATDPSWANSWASAAAMPVAEGETPIRRGWDAGVITDEMILERVRAVKDEKGDI